MLARIFQDALYSRHVLVEDFGKLRAGKSSGIAQPQCPAPLYRHSARAVFTQCSNSSLAATNSSGVDMSMSEKISSTCNSSSG